MTDDLLVKYMLDEVSPEEMQQVENWLKESHVNAAYYEQLLSVWQHSKKIAAVSDADEMKAWQQLQARIHQDHAGRKPVSMVTPFPVKWLRMAAMLVVFAGLGLITYMVLNKETVNPDIVAITTGNIRQEVLPDGSRITLNKNSSLTYPQQFKGSTRSVVLKGEAFFNVTPDKSKPFLIRINDVMVRVVGTSFNVRNRNGSTEVIVETGIVEVTRNSRSVVLHPKEKVMVTPRDTVLSARPENEQLYNYYRTKEFVCDNTPLWKLVDVLNEAYNVNITIARPELRSLPITTTFSNESLDHILEVVALTHKLHVVHSNDRIMLQ